MKKFLFNRIIACIVMLFCNGVPGYCQDDNLTPVRLSHVEDVFHNRRRMPSSAASVILPSVFYNSATKTLCFVSEISMDGLPVEISEQEDGGSVCLQDFISVEPDRTTRVGIGFLPSGCYAITIWIQGSAYTGTFEVEE